MSHIQTVDEAEQNLSHWIERVYAIADGFGSDFAEHKQKTQLIPTPTFWQLFKSLFI